MRQFHFLDMAVPAWLVALVFYVAWVIAGWSFKKILFAWLARLTRKTATQIDDIIISAAFSRSFRLEASSFSRWHFLYFFPEPQWQGSFLPSVMVIKFKLLDLPSTVDHR